MSTYLVYFSGCDGKASRIKATHVEVVDGTLLLWDDVGIKSAFSSGVWLSCYRVDEQ